ncbi:hypothetical protein DSUL_80086 [Desulfovibrionales bacterium]
MASIFYHWKIMFKVMFFEHEITDIKWQSIAMKPKYSAS